MLNSIFLGLTKTLWRKTGAWRHVRSVAIVKVSIGTERTGAAGRAATTPVDAGVSFQGPTATAGNWQVTQSLLRVLFEIFLRLELVLQQFGKVTHILSRCGLSSAHRFERNNYINFLTLSE